jgi:hypothetical protein
MGNNSPVEEILTEGDHKRRQELFLIYLESTKYEDSFPSFIEKQLAQ